MTPIPNRGSVRFWIYLVLTAGAICTVFPFLWMISSSLKSNAEILVVAPTLVPKAWRWENYTEVVNMVPFLRIYWNTIFVTIVRVAGHILFGSMAAFALARLRFPGKEFVFLIIVAILMIPSQATLIPNYILIARLGWLNSYTGLIAPGLVSAVGTFLMRQFFMTLPDSLEEAAKMDGCNPFMTYVRIALPLAGPVLSAYGLLAILWSWNEFVWPLIVSSSERMYLLSVAIGLFQNQYEENIPLMMAAAVMATFPILAVFLSAQRSLVEGVTLSGLKG